MQKKTRLDVAVFEGGYAPSREKAKAIIMAGQVYVNNQKVDKAGFELKEGDKLEVRGKTLKYVSRGGLKLEKAMQVFPITLADKICMDGVGCPQTPVLQMYPARPCGKTGRFRLSLPAKRQRFAPRRR